MSDRYITQMKLASLAGVTKGAVNKNVKSGRLPTVIFKGKKAIDLQDVIIQEYINSRTNQRKKKPKPKPEPPKQKTKTKQFEQAEIPMPPEDQPASVKYGLECTKLKKQIEQINIKNRTELGNLIPRDMVKQVFSRLYSIDTNQTLQLSASISSRIAASVFGNNDPEKITKVSEIIDEELYKIQAHKKRIIADEFKKMAIEEA